MSRQIDIVHLCSASNTNLNEQNSSRLLYH